MPIQEDNSTPNVGGINQDQIRSYVERIERLEEEKTELAEHIKEVYVEAKSAGFDVPPLKAVIRERRRDPRDVEDQETMEFLYKKALGMVPGPEQGDV